MLAYSFPSSRSFSASPFPNSDEAEKKVLIVVNPASGSGRALGDYQKIVVKILKDYRQGYDTIITESRGHCISSLLSRSITQYKGIITIGGDGTIFDLVNALATHPEKGALAVPINPLPSGSGNGLHASIEALYPSRDKLSHFDAVSKATYRVIDGGKRSLDLMQVEVEKVDGIFQSFLATGVGIIPDVDVKSNLFRRCCPYFRFELGTVLAILRKRSYEGTVYYLPEQYNLTGLKPLDEDLDPFFIKEEGKFLLVMGTGPSHLAKDAALSAEAKLDDRFIHLTIIPSDISRWSLVKLFMNFNRGFNRSIKTKAFRWVPKNRGTGVITVDGEQKSPGAFQVMIGKKRGRVLVDREYLRSSDRRSSDRRLGRGEANFNYQSFNG